MKYRHAHLMAGRASPLLLAGLIGVLLLLLIAGAWALYDLGRYRAGFNSMQAERLNESYEQDLATQRQQISELRGELARIQSGKEVDAYANEEIKKTLVSLQQENQELREELQFYRSIVSPSRGRPGVHIHNFQLTQGEKAGKYYYNITLIHIQGQTKHHREVKGEVKLLVEGEQGGVVKKLEMADLTTPRRSSIRFVFKYFTRFEGSLDLPPNFNPRNILVQAVSGTKKINGDEKQIEWPSQATTKEDNQNAGES